MTKDEALKMAIEQIQHLIEVYMPSPEWTGTAIQKECYEVLNACKEALQLETSEQEPIAELVHIGNGETFEVVFDMRKIVDLPNHTKFYTSPQASEQEPADVARVQYDGYSIEWRPDMPHLPVGTKLYARPPEWQGLTDDEVDNIYPCAEGVHDFRDIVRAIEQALKEKNHVTER
jgi:hypothetical protein